MFLLEKFKYFQKCSLFTGRFGFYIRNKTRQKCCPLLFFLLGTFRSSPARQLNLTGRFGVPHHELNILQVPRRGKPNGVWEEDEEDSGGDDQEKRDSHTTVRVVISNSAKTGRG